MSPLLTTLITMVVGLVAMAFYTLLERKILGYVQLRKGPNKVGVMGLAQPFADALKLFAKEHNRPKLMNFSAFIVSPLLGLTIALVTWTIYPNLAAAYFMPLSILYFLALSSFNVYTTLAAGWASNSKYALLGALRAVAQTISYEVSMALILIAALLLTPAFNFFDIMKFHFSPTAFIAPHLFILWYITTIAETNRAPFDFAEGESELVSGFNTEFSAGSFALIFMAEYANILIMCILSATIFFAPFFISFTFALPILTLEAWILAFGFIWVRGSYPRMRYDRLMSLTWKTFLPWSLAAILLLSPLTAAL
uniref:NADH-ubiquinone oxidoreductase chain 1 n=1 Tax=Pharyngocirrus uchidai TaxID=2498818 RepID=A0A7G9IX16_9ANNE|nr:NADH dehydrogenase subunit 1 [Pharyngocirrus uchidai]QNM39910.1 NADH dehydrogenase subunit 1 [Pharyngocirrus uchidai]